MAIAARDATSHGATSSLAKLVFSGTKVLSSKFPLLFGGTRPVGPCMAAPLTLGLIREIAGARRGGAFCFGSSSSESSAACRDNLRLFLEGPAEISSNRLSLSEDHLLLSLADNEGDCDDIEAFRRVPDLIVEPTISAIEVLLRLRTVDCELLVVLWLIP